MAKQHPRNFSLSQWFFIAAPTIAGAFVAAFDRRHMEFPMPLYVMGAALCLSFLLCFVMVYGEDL